MARVQGLQTIKGEGNVFSEHMARVQGLHTVKGFMCFHSSYFAQTGMHPGWKNVAKTLSLPKNRKESMASLHLALTACIQAEKMWWLGHNMW